MTPAPFQNSTLRAAARRVLLVLALGLIALAMLVFACGPSSPGGQVGGGVVESTPTLTAETETTANTTNTPEATATPTDTPTPTSTEPANTPEPTATETVVAVNSDPCQSTIDDLGWPVAPYRFGGASGGDAAGDADSPEPTITIDWWATVTHAYAGEFYPPTIENMTLFHDLIVHGMAGTRTDLLNTTTRGDNRAIGFVNFRVSEYLKGSGPEFICIYDQPEMRPFGTLHTGQEYVLMLEDLKNLIGYDPSTAPDAYRSGSMGWRVIGDRGIQFAQLPEMYEFVITTDRRQIYSIWVTPEPRRVWPVGESIALETLKERINDADNAANP